MRRSLSLAWQSVFFCFRLPSVGTNLNGPHFLLSADSQFAVASAADEVLKLTDAVIITHGHQGVKLMGVVPNS